MTNPSSEQWEQIRLKAAQFGHDWANETSERAEAQTFWNEFLAVFGIERRKVAQFEQQVEQLNKPGKGRIDLFWPRKLLAEHKSAGRDLDAAYLQGTDYFHGIEEDDLPAYVAVSDFARMRLYDVKTGDVIQFPITQLHRHVEDFAFLLGLQQRHLEERDPVNERAALEMAKLHDELAANGYSGHQLQVLLVRLLFLLFADDTGLMSVNMGFEDFLHDYTRADASDLGPKLWQMFDTLDQPYAERQENLDDFQRSLPYVNGELFSEPLRMAAFSEKMRARLLRACKVDWGEVSPAIFGAMFQGVVDKTLRRRLGAHYTSEENILKVLGPLFLDDLKTMREGARGNPADLLEFLNMLPKLRFFDPACGSGNFLILAYRELRRLELSALQEMLKNGRVLDISTHVRVNVEQFYGIEFDEFPAQIARTAMWLTDHQMNVEARWFGQNFPTLPLVRSAHITNGDALETNWAAILNLEVDASTIDYLYIVGNPPFSGRRHMSVAQREQVQRLFQGITNAGNLDYVAGWYLRSSQLMTKITKDWKHIKVAAALVSTNSITQGEQVSPLWETVLNDYKQIITFAHRTFKWQNDARNNAAVHCVIIGFRPLIQAPKRYRLFEYASPISAPTERAVTSINPYLTDGPQVIVRKVQRPLRRGVPELSFGNMPLDDGHLCIDSQAELDALLAVEPGAEKFIRPMLGANEIINGEERWVLWLKDAEPAELRKLPEIMKRVQAVHDWRASRDRVQTVRMANSPTSFGELRHPNGPYLAVPGVSSERREYIPMVFLDQNTIIKDQTFSLPGTDLFQFGLMQSRLHMDWMRAISGRMKSDYRYSKNLTYNTFPWLDRSSLKTAQVQAIEDAAQQVLEARSRYPGSNLAALYDPLAMPADLRTAHDALDRFVERSYGIKSNSTEAQRLAHLLKLYQADTPTLASQTAAPAKRSRKKASAKV